MDPAATEQDRDTGYVTTILIVVGCVLGAFVLAAAVAVAVLTRRRTTRSDARPMLSHQSGRSSYATDNQSIGVPFDTYKMPSGKHADTDVLHWKQSNDRQTVTHDQFVSPYDKASIDADSLGVHLKE